MNRRFLDSLRRLLERTDAGGVRWEKTADEQTFRIGLGEGVIRINRSRDHEGDYLYTASLLNAELQEVESASVWNVTTSRSPDTAFLPDLFESARRSALNVSALLDSIDRAIEAGAVSPIVDPESDIPF